MNTPGKPRRPRIAAALAAVAIAAGSAMGATVGGRVLAAPGGKTVADATVTLWHNGAEKAQTATTGPTGRYLFANVRPSRHEYVLRVRSLPQGMWVEGVAVTVPAAEAAIVAADLPLARAQSLSGTVREAGTGKPAAGVRINFSTTDAKGNRDAVTTDADGRFRLHVLPRTVELYCFGSHDRWLPLGPAGDRRVPVPAGRRVGDVDFQVVSAPPFGGRLLLANGEPAVDVEVYANVTWSHGTVQDQQRLAEARKRAETRPARVRPMPVVAGGLWSEACGRSYRLRTDEQGGFRGYLRRPGLTGLGSDAAIDVVLCGRLSDRSMGVMHILRTTTLDPPPPPVTLRLQPTGAAEFQIIDPDRRGVSGAALTVTSVVGHSLWSWTPAVARPEVESLAGGRHRVEGLIAGWHYRFHAKAEGYRCRHGLDVTGVSGRTLKKGTFPLEWWGRKAVPGLIEKLSSKQYQDCDHACRNLGELGPVAAPAVPHLIRSLREDPAYTIRRAAAGALGRIGRPARVAVPFLLQSLHEGTPGMARTVTVALGLLEDPSALPALETALVHREVEVRRAALAALKRETFRDLDAAIGPLLEAGPSHPAIVHHDLAVLAMRALRTESAGRVAVLLEAPLRADLSDELLSVAELITGERLNAREELLAWWWRLDRAEPPVPAAASEPGRLDALWRALAAPVSLAAHRATRRMAGGGEATVAFLAERLQPASADAGRIASLFADLDHHSFAVREAASERLSHLGAAAEAALRAALKADPSPELRVRVESLLDATSRPYPATAEARRAARAVRILELIATPKAIALLRRLASGAPDALLTRRAKAALDRIHMGQRASGQ